MKNLETILPSVRMIKRSKLKECVYRNLEKSGDPSKIKKTLDTALDAIVSIRLDNRVMATNMEGKEVLLTLMGTHVYTWHNKELIDAVKECFEEENFSNMTDREDRENILELSADDKRILATN